MTKESLRKIIREIIQSEIQPEPRGGGIQADSKGMGMWHDEKSFYHTQREFKSDLWHQGEEKESEVGETKQTPENFPAKGEQRPSGQVKWDKTNS